MLQTYLAYVALVVAGFLLGLLVMRARSRQSFSQATGENTLASAAAARQLELAKMQNTLASAAIDTHRGDYESARTTASSFFTSLRAEASKGADSVLSQVHKDGVEPLFARRDELISLLARNDPAAAERLSDLYVSFRELTSK
jgi:hypothetical protein